MGRGPGGSVLHGIRELRTADCDLSRLAEPVSRNPLLEGQRGQLPSLPPIAGR